MMAVDIDLLTLDHNTDKKKRVILRMTYNSKVTIRSVDYHMTKEEWEALKMRVDAKFAEER